jgi:hypothetical protein
MPCTTPPITFDSMCQRQVTLQNIPCKKARLSVYDTPQRLSILWDVILCTIGTDSCGVGRIACWDGDCKDPAQAAFGSALFLKCIENIISPGGDGELVLACKRSHRHTASESTNKSGFAYPVHAPLPPGLICADTLRTCLRSGDFFGMDFSV